MSICLRHPDLISDFFQNFLKKLDLWPKMRGVFLFHTENTWLWSHFGDMNLSRKTHVFAKLFLVYVFIHLTESSHQTYASDKVP
jgi:hypothetical protein